MFILNFGLTREESRSLRWRFPVSQHSESWGKSVKPCTRSEYIKIDTKQQEFQSINTAKDLSFNASSCTQPIVVCFSIGIYSESLSVGVIWWGKAVRRLGGSANGLIGSYFCQASSSSGLLQTFETTAARMEGNLGNHGSQSVKRQGLIPCSESAAFAQIVGVGFSQSHRNFESFSAIAANSLRICSLFIRTIPKKLRDSS